MKVVLSKHAMDRLLSRTGLSLEDFKEIYNKEKILPIGKEKIHQEYMSYFIVNSKINALFRLETKKILKLLLFYQLTIIAILRKYLKMLNNSLKNTLWRRKLV